MSNPMLSNIKVKSSDRGTIIKEKRKELNISQKELADAIRMPKYGDRTIRRWEKGETSPSQLEFSAIMDFLKKIDDKPFKNDDNAPYKMIDLFAGIGGTRLGFQLTGKIKSVFSSEMDKFAQKTYYANYDEKPYGDITEIDEKTIPNHDILVAGFPCQAFSQAGKRLGFEDTRGTLFFDVARIIKEKRPKMFLLENVKSLKTHDRNQTYKIIKNTLIELDYDVKDVLYKAREFGVPQNRERIYIIGFDKRTIESENIDKFELPIPPKTETHVGDILQDVVDEKYTISDKLWAGHKRRKAAHLNKGNGFGYTLFNAESPYTNTISARYYKDGSEILIEQIGENPRKVTPREAARLQGFPENFIIPVSDTQAYKQFGNSVCVPVVQAIAQEMLEILDLEHKQIVNHDAIMNV